MTNPWLAWLGILAGVGFTAGAGLYLSNAPDEGSLFEDGPTQTLQEAANQALGLALMQIGGALAAGLLIAGAICWQIRQRR